jgi:thiol-disulfide isomerase/thioredoxin
LKCLAKAPEDRWQTSKDLHEVLKWVASADLQSVIAASGSSRTKLLTSVALVLLLAVSSVSTILWIKVDHEREKAVTASQKAGKGQQFLSDVLTSSFPYGYGDEVTVLNIIDRASEKLNGSFLNEPEIESELRLSLGNAYGKIGHYREAERELTIALSLSERAFGATHDKTLSLLNDLFSLNRVLGDSEALLSVARKSEAAAEKRFGDSHEETFWAKDVVAYALEQNARIDEAAEKMREGWVGFRDVIKTDTSSILNAQIQYAWLLLKQGKKVQSQKLSREAYDLAKSVGSDAMRDAQSTLAAVHIVHGEIDSAKAIYDNQVIPTTFGIERTFQGNFDLSNKPFQLIVFFETWCPYSRQAMSDLAEVDRQYNQLGLNICGMTRVNRSAKEEELGDYLSNLNVDFTVVKENGRTWNYFDCEGTPSVRLIHDGYLIWEKRYYSSDPISTQMLESIAAVQSESGIH